MMERTHRLHRDSDLSLRYIRDRINVPRDMPMWSARRLRQACGDVAKACGNRRSDVSIAHVIVVIKIPFRSVMVEIAAVM